MTDERIALGREGEEAAREYLIAEGWEVLAQNWRCPAGELDLVVSRTVARGAGAAELLAFVEVKTRRGGLAPKLSVGARKRRQLARLARWFLKELGWRAVIGRFDVVEVELERGADEPVIRHHEGVFDAAGRARR